MNFSFNSFLLLPLKCEKSIFHENHRIRCQQYKHDTNLHIETLRSLRPGVPKLSEPVGSCGILRGNGEHVSKMADAGGEAMQQAFVLLLKSHGNNGRPHGPQGTTLGKPVLATLPTKRDCVLLKHRLVLVGGTLDGSL